MIFGEIKESGREKKMNFQEGHLCVNFQDWEGLTFTLSLKVAYKE